MTAVRVAVIAAYCAAYALAFGTGTHAVQTGEHLYALALFTAAAGLLLGIRREYRHTAHLIRARAVTRRTPPIEIAVSLPPGCHCDTWWASLGRRHDQHCPAHPHRGTP